MYLILGITVGATAAVLWAKGLEPDWVEAAGTWFGGVGTILTLLWAVRTFKADQADREAQQQRKDEEASRALQAAAQAQLDQASQVSSRLRGGGGYGREGEKKMTSIHLDFTNDSPVTAIVTDIDLDKRLVPKKPLPLPARIPPHDSWTHLIDIEDVSARDHVLSGKPLEGFGAQIFYTIENRTWSRRGAQAPVAIP